ncbi:hypothetical protein EC988_005016 [Linderina pennispora]|nr:hypothetical protein EC988_005016 [Linderina pennispora]
MMLASFAVVALASGLLAAAQGSPKPAACTTAGVRKEIRSLTDAEWSAVSSVVLAMNRDGWGRWFAYVHTQNFNTIHGNSQFFPFHRRFTIDYEQIAQRYSSSFYLPYWDTVSDYRAPQTSEVLTNKYIGGNGQGANGCLSDGFLANINVGYPNTHCLVRKFDKGDGIINSWYAPEYILSIIQRDTTMAQFRPDMEMSLHGAVHLGLGGDMIEQWSPNDFAFMLHHANMDRLWDQWQDNGNTWVMDGVDNKGANMTIDSQILAYNEPVSSVMQLGHGSACYYYDTNLPEDRNLPSQASAVAQSAVAKDKSNSSNGKKNSGEDSDDGKKTKRIVHPAKTSKPDIDDFFRGVASDVAAGVQQLNEDIKDGLEEVDQFFKDAFKGITKGLSKSLHRSAQNVVTTLPPNVLDKWFPKMAGLGKDIANNKVAGLKRPQKGHNIANMAVAAIPAPPTLGNKWAKMHKFDAAEVRRYNEKARQFVQDLQDAQYVPLK